MLLEETMISKQTQWLWWQVVSSYPLPKHHFILQETFLHSQGIVEHMMMHVISVTVSSFTWSPAFSRYFDFRQSCFKSQWTNMWMFAITCSHNFLDKYIEIITAETSNGSCTRKALYAGSESKLAWQCMVPFHWFCSVRFPEYALVVLQPHHFLPDNSLLPLYSRQHRRKVSGLKHYKNVLGEQTATPGWPGLKEIPSILFHWHPKPSGTYNKPIPYHLGCWDQI